MTEQQQQPKIWAIIPAAGVGVRMSAEMPKQYLRIQGVSILQHTLSRICASSLISGVVIGLSRADVWWDEIAFTHPKILGTCEGGEQRQDTVLNALRFVDTLQHTTATDWVLVHDAVRPCFKEQDIQNLLNEANDNQKGAVLGKKLTDTLKMTDQGQAIQQTVARKNCWRAFTPQMFRLGDLLSALEAALADGIAVTDESMAMERLGIYAAMVEGHFGNHKITTTDDLDLATLLLTMNQVN